MNIIKSIMLTQNAHDCCLKEDTTVKSTNKLQSNYNQWACLVLGSTYCITETASIAQICKQWFQVFWHATCVHCAFWLCCLNSNKTLGIYPFLSATLAKLILTFTCLQVIFSSDIISCSIIQAESTYLNFPALQDSLDKWRQIQLDLVWC